MRTWTSAAGVMFGREWKNSFGMRFLPLGDILMAVWETRRKEFMDFVKATGARRPMNANPESGKASQLPVVGIDRDEARSFCAWLTKRDRDSGAIGKDDRYRLPTDEEWSRAVGLPPETRHGSSGTQRAHRRCLPLGYEWPPPSGIDNLADENAGRLAALPTVISGYKDRFAGPAPVTALPPGPKGFVGLAGNVSDGWRPIFTPS